MENLISQLPPMLSGDELTEALYALPTYDSEIRKQDVSNRILALEDLYRIYIPSEISRETYTKLYISIIRGLKNKESIEAVKQQNQNFLTMKGQEHRGIITGADSFTILGASGIGKSTAIAKAIDLATNGNMITTDTTTIIPCIQVQCPFDCSAKNLLLNILDTIDRTVGSNYYEKAIRARATTDILIGSVSNILLNRVCVLIIDEIQNVVNHRAGNSLVGVLVQLINNSGITVCMVGIPESETFFQKTDYLARRAVGLRFEKMEYGSEFIHFCQTIYGYQYTQKAEPFNESHSLWLYEHTGGVIALVLALLHDAQEIAILEGGDTLSIAALEAAYKKRYSMIKGNKIVKLSKTGTKKKNSVAISMDTTKTENNSIANDCVSRSYSTVINTAKAQNLDMIRSLKTHFKVWEVAL